MIFFLLLVSACTADDLFFDAELDMTMPELIRHYGYPCEEVNVTTKDGYILTHHRIPKGRDPRPAPHSNPDSRPVVIFVHGLLSDSSNFVMNPPTSSAGYIFADAGFDVWLLNCRGSKYSLAHEFMSPDDKAFWKFSWYEMGMRDVTDTVDYILELTGQDSVYYIGHSQGTTVAFARLADDPDGSFGKKIRQFHGLGPNGGMEYNFNPWFQVLRRSPIYDTLLMLGDIVGGFDVVLPEFLQEIAAKACLTPFFAKLLIQTYELFPPLPERNGQMNESRVDLYLKHFPGSEEIFRPIIRLMYQDLKERAFGRILAESRSK